MRLAARTALAVKAAAGGLAALRRLPRPPVRWSAPTGEVHDVGLSVRVAGQGSPRWLLLHGMFRSGRYWSAEFDDLGRTVIASDLLGFGRSRSAAPACAEEVTAAVHADSIAACLDRLAVTDPVVVVGHSVGAVIGAHLASRHPSHVAGIVAINPALFCDADDARARPALADPYTRLFLARERLSEEVCALMCRHRRLAGTVARTNPRMPAALNDDAVEHTWASYHGTVTNVVLTDDHRELIAGLACPVHVVAAADDHVVDIDFLGEMSAMAHVTIERMADAGHDLPITDPTGCARLVRAAGAAQPAPGRYDDES